MRGFRIMASITKKLASAGGIILLSACVASSGFNARMKARPPRGAFTSQPVPTIPLAAAADTAAATAPGGYLDDTGPPNPAQKQAAEALIASIPIRPGNRVTLLRDGQETYAAMFRAVGAAQHQVNLETYIFEDDNVGHRFARLLEERVRAGVAVNVIYDSVGSVETSAAFFDELRHNGVHLYEFNPINPLKAGPIWRANQRDHRKILVVDGKVAFVGGVNISAVYSGSARHLRLTPMSSAQHKRYPWRDTHVEISGPAVAEIQKLFVENWNKLDGPPLDRDLTFPSLASQGAERVRVLGGTPDDSSNPIFVSLIHAVNQARRSVHITNAYFVPDPQTVGALERAARRGVDVNLVLPSVSDSKLVLFAGHSYYSELLAAGVKIYERKHAVLHAKTAVIDGVWSTVGSSNLDWRSRVHNEEVNVVIFGAAFGQQMEQMFQSDIAAAHAIDAPSWAKRSLWTRVQEWGARLWAYWL